MFQSDYKNEPGCFVCPHYNNYLPNGCENVRLPVLEMQPPFQSQPFAQ